MWIEIDSERLNVDNVQEYGYLPIIETDNGKEYYVAVDSRQAGEAAREYWEDLAQDDPGEFRCLVGDETLVKWCLGQHAGPGTTQAKSLDEWLDLWLDVPEEQWAGWDGTELDVTAASPELIDTLGFVPTVAYRWN